MDFEQLLIDHIKERLTGDDFNRELLPEIAEIYKESIINQSSRQQDPSGKAWARLQDEPYKTLKSKELRNTKADLHYVSIGGQRKAGARQDGAFEVMDYTIENGSVLFNFGGADSDQISTYMNAHNTGTGRMPQRRWVPDREDGESPVQQENIRKVADLTEKFLGKEVTIQGAQIIVNV